jgi:hypothetical protein
VSAGYANISLNNAPIRENGLGTRQYRIQHAHSHRLLPHFALVHT